MNTKKEIITNFPNLDEFASDKMVHSPDDLLFNPPCVQNGLGTAQCANSVTAFSSVQFPPFLSNCVTDAPWTLPFMPTCEITLDGKIFGAWSRPNAVTNFQWFPHQVVREATLGDIKIRSELFLPKDSMAVAQRIVLTNQSDVRKEGTASFSLHSALSQANFDINGTPRFLGAATDEHNYDELVGDVPNLPEPVCESDNLKTIFLGKGAVLYQAQHSKAFSVQGFGEEAISMDQGRRAKFAYELEAGESRTFTFAMAIGETQKEVVALFDHIQDKFDQIQKASEDHWQYKINNIFDSEDLNYFSGSLPTLEESATPWMKRIYYCALATMLFLRTDNPNSVFGPLYLSVRSQQRPARFYLWDLAFIAPVVAKLDPTVLRVQLEAWMNAHITKHMDIDFITGKSLENHYPSNHYSLVYSVEYYLKETNDYAWLDKKIKGKKVYQHLVDNALFWKTVQSPETGLADWTDSDLLEVVQSYDGQIAGFQAGFVYAMRFVATLAEERGDSSVAIDLREEADLLAKNTIKHLYVEGEGVWRCIHRDGSRPVVRHIYDVITILEFMGDDLSDQQISEIIGFFWNELAVDTWLHALSPNDVDAYWNKRADHSWCGSYPGWPAIMACQLMKYDPSPRTLQWIKSLAKSSNQGTYGQAHMVPGAFPDENGGAQKAPLVMPLLSEWGCLAGVEFADLILSYGEKLQES